MKFSRRWFWLLLLVPIAIGLARLRFDVEVLNLLPQNSNVVQGLKLYQQNFSNGRELIITVRSPDPQKTETAARTLATTLRNSTNLVASADWQPGWLEYPAQSAELVASLWLNQPPEIFGELTNRLAPQNLSAALVETKEQLAMSLSPQEIALRSYDPFNLMRLPESVSSAMPVGSGQELFASPDGKFRLVFVQSREELPSYRDCLVWLEKIKTIVAAEKSAAQFGNEIEIHYTGRPAFISEIAGGMQSDMIGSVTGTMFIIAALFWIAHRRFRALAWILISLAIILGGTMALGGLIFGTINVVSMGFAAILLGLAVDYGLVIYQETQAAPNLNAKEIRRQIAPSILWAALTTAGAFAILNLGGLPGLSQLGSLVALGVVLAAFVMLYVYLPLVQRGKKIEERTNHAPDNSRAEITFSKIAWIATALISLCAIFVLLKNPPHFDHSSDALRPERSPAYETIEEIKIALGKTQDPLWLLVSGSDEQQVAERLRRAEVELNHAAINGEISSFTLPTLIWPQPKNQIANRDALKILLAEQPQLRAAAFAEGFSTNALALTEKLFETWQIALSQTNVFWPTNQASRWILDKISTQTPKGFLAAGLVYAATNSNGNDFATTKKFASNFEKNTATDGTILSGWPLLGASMLDLVEKDFPRVLIPMTALLLFSLWLAFRRMTEVLLSFATLAFSGLCLFLLMSLAHWSWNLLNLMALPLLLGAGVDYSIHMQIALRRHHGNLRAVRRSIGRALWLCGGTTIAGFGSLAWSNNAGLSSLGKVCAAGIATTMLTSIFLLPIWWSTLAGRKNRGAISTKPSSLYRAKSWQLGLWLVRKLPSGTCAALAKILGTIYWLLARERREIVVQNLLPVANNDSAVAKKLARKLFQNFAQKLIDLWRYESGVSIDDLFCELTGWERFLAAQKENRGVLIITPHLGNWEFGAPLLAKKGHKLLVVTLEEPDAKLTEMRQAARARWGIETLVIGKNPFAFVEIIRRLEAGAAVALLIDRPPASSSIDVQFFGKTFAASVAGAELARASGCILLPVYLPRLKNGYAGHILPEISYNRAALRSPECRRELTQKIMNAFEEPIREHPDQWYHFVPIWNTCSEPRDC